MKNAIKSMLAPLVSLALAGGANAGVVIDLFSEPANASNVVIDSTMAGNPAVNCTGAAPCTTSDGGVAAQFGPVAGPPYSIIGQYRDLYVEKTRDEVFSRNVGDAKLQAGGGGLSFSTESGVSARASVQWDGGTDAANPEVLVKNGLGGLDLTTCGALVCDRFITEVLDADLGFSYSIGVYDVDGMGNFANFSILSSAVQFAVQPSSPASADYLFDWFKLAPGLHTEGGLTFFITRSAVDVDFTRIGALELTLEGTKIVNGSPVAILDFDFTIGSITTTVPEPGMLALVGVALMAAGATSRRRNFATAANA